MINSHRLAVKGRHLRKEPDSKIKDQRAATDRTSSRACSRCPVDDPITMWTESELLHRRIAAATPKQNRYVVPAGS